ncbi:MAG TPA: hypothetical protein VFY29_06605, partial [Terriglobia bacterium]|nr:hypothetical protein [Terriglobia bacterium]
RVRAVLEHYENQTEDEAVAEDEAAFRKRGQTVMVVPTPLVPAITRLITKESTIVMKGRHNKPLQPASGAQRVRSSKRVSRAARG